MIESVSRRAFGSSSGTYNVRASELARDRKVNTIGAAVTFLDDSQHCFQIEKKAKGCELLELVFQYLELVEKEYFGLQFTENNTPPGPNNAPITRWIEGHKRVRRQAGATPTLWLGVRFWPSEPARLEPPARRLLCLQLRRMLRDGRLPAPRPARLLLASYQAQAELGDWTSGGDAVSLIDSGLEGAEELRRVRELHRLHRGQPRAVADLHYLEHARRLDRYGVDTHPAKPDSQEGMPGIPMKGISLHIKDLRHRTIIASKN